MGHVMDKHEVYDWMMMNNASLYDVALHFNIEVTDAMRAVQEVSLEVKSASAKES